MTDKFDTFKQFYVEWRQRQEAEAEALAHEEEAFLYDLSDRLGINKSDLERLIEIAVRRANP